jgi:hypothetical protein
MEMLSYLRKFVKDFSALTDVFRPLSNDCNDWFWTEHHTKTMKKIQSLESWTHALQII